MRHPKAYSALLVFTLGMLLLLSACQRAPDLAGSDWTLVSLYQDPLIPQTTITAEFVVGPWVIEGSAGCNSYQAVYGRDGAQIIVGEILVGDDFCEQPEGIMEQEEIYLDALMEMRRYQIEAGQLQMLDAQEIAILIYDLLDVQ